MSSFDPVRETFLHRSYSQCGEDRMVSFLLDLLGVHDSVNYLDVGAAYAVDGNNTFLFHDRCGVGVLVEADAKYLPQYQRLRSKDIALIAACVPARLYNSEGINFHVASNPGWSSVSAEHIATAERLGKGPQSGTINVPTLTINDIVEKYFSNIDLHFLSIDIEGIDREVLSELDFSRCSPLIISAENAGGDRIHDAVMLREKYRMFAYNTINTIYVRGAAYEEVMRSA